MFAGLVERPPTCFKQGPRFGQIDPGTVSVDWRKFSERFDRRQGVLWLAGRGLRGSEPQAIVEIVRKEGEQNPVHRRRLIPFQARFSVPSFNQQPLFAKQVGRKIHGFFSFLSRLYMVAEHGQ